MRVTKQQLLDAFLLYLDDSLPSFECEKIQKNGNSSCQFRCDVCMLEQYIKKAKENNVPKAKSQNNGKYYPKLY